jgi:hypothetical protein
MSNSDDKKALEDLEKSFMLLTTDPLSQAAYEQRRAQDLRWKERDPEGYKKDMEKMCREMFGDGWQIQYEAMLREEFPEESPGGD